MKYNIALVPNDTLQFIDIAKSYAQDTDYLLNIKTIPHVTVAEFTVFMTDDIIDILKLIKLIKYNKVELHFSSGSAKKENEHYWLDLLPTHNAYLQMLHTEIVHLLKSNRISCINNCLTKYVPHLTIARTTNTKLAYKFTDFCDKINDTFSLVLGITDDIGRMFEIKCIL